MMQMKAENQCFLNKSLLTMLDQNHQTGVGCEGVWRKKAHGCSKVILGQPPTEALLFGLEVRMKCTSEDMKFVQSK